MALRFGDCRFDVDARRLFRGSREVHLSPKAFEALQLLVEARPRALSKAELLERVWSGVFVSESSLTKVVNEIRTALGDAARASSLVRTVHGYGYAFVADATDDRPSPMTAHQPGACWLVCGHREFALTDGEHIVGREPDAGVWLASPKVSRRHARVIVAGPTASIEDLSSKNGTSVRGVRISMPVPLEPGDEIEIGPFRLVFRAGIDPVSTETEVAPTLRVARGRLSRGGRAPEAR